MGPTPPQPPPSPSSPHSSPVAAAVAASPSPPPLHLRPARICPHRIRSASTASVPLDPPPTFVPKTPLAVRHRKPSHPVASILSSSPPPLTVVPMMARFHHATSRPSVSVPLVSSPAAFVLEPPVAVLRRQKQGRMLLFVRKRSHLLSPQMLIVTKAVHRWIWPEN